MTRSNLASLFALALLVSAPAGATEINLWFADVAPFAHFPAPAVTGSLVDPSGAVFNDKHWRSDLVSDDDFLNFRIRAYGYRTQDSNGTGLFTQFNASLWDGGLGVCDQNGSNNACGGAPQHSVDNNGRDDLVLIDFGEESDGEDHRYRPVSFSIGWENFADCTGTSQGGGCPDIEAWVGDSLPDNWAFITNALNGWTQVLFAGPSFPDNDIQPNTAANPHYYSFSGSVPGRYLVIAGERDGSNNDYFKLQSLVIERRTPPTEVPEPGALPLAGAAAGLALLFARRRRTK
jgi:hypothetical protein